jgi:hypothetical protein
MGRAARARAKNRDYVLTIRQPCARCDALVIVDHYQCFAPRPLCARCAKGVGVSNPLIPYPNAEQLPLVGQPCAINSWVPILSLTCNCDAKPALLIVGLGNLTMCPACKRGFQLHGVTQDIRTGKPPHFDLNIVLPAVEPGKPS